MTGKDLRIVFMGTPEFAVGSLKALVEAGYNVVAVVTVPDKPAGRGQQISQSAVKQYALSQNLPVLQPEKLKEQAFVDEMKSFRADLQIVVAFRMLPEIIWSIPRLGTFNLHASLLPKYRGAAPINRAIMAGETETGVTTFLLQHEIDTGNILFQEKLPIAPTDNVEVVYDALMNIGSQLVLKTVEALAANNVTPLSQNAIIANGVEPTPAPKIFKEDCLINWASDGQSIHNHVRGLSPYPAAWTNLYHSDIKKTTTMKIFSVVFKNDETAKIGTIKSDNKKSLEIACSNGWLSITELQLAGKKRMKTEEFLRGFHNIEEFTSVEA